MDIAQTHPSSTFRVLNVNNGEIAILQSVSWHSETLEVRGDGDQAVASGGGSSTGGKQILQHSPEVNMEVATAMPPTTQQSERTGEPADGTLELGVGHESDQGHKSKSKGGDPEQHTASDSQQPQPTATLRKLNNAWTGNPPTVLSSCTRGVGGAAVTDGHEASLNVVLASDDELEHETVAHKLAANLSAMMAALVKPGGHGNDLTPEPQNRRQAMCVCVCVFFPFILGIKFVGRTTRGHTGGRSHRISHPPSFCGACLNFSREKDSAIPFPRRP